MEADNDNRAKGEKSAKVVTRRLVKPRLDIKYPQVEGLKDRFVEKMINSSLLDIVYDQIRMQGYVQDSTKELTGTYETKLNQDGLLSVVLDNYGYAKGAAHGITYRNAATLSLTDGTEYTFADLFKHDSNYRDVISDMIKRQIKEKDIPELTPFTDVGDNPDFYLTPDALVVFFQLYEYTPYAYGFPTFEIPYTAIKGILNPDGPIAKLV